MITYNVKHIVDDTYEVIKKWNTVSRGGEEQSIFQGTLDDCESFIKLNKGCYI